jgi:heme-degrading monooxygenase HmoA
MHARTIEAKLVPGMADEALRIFHEEVVPVVKAQPGYVSTALYLDRDNNAAMTVSVWESEEAEAATSTSSSYLKNVVGKLSHCLVNRGVKSWDVAYHDG